MIYGLEDDYEFCYDGRQFRLVNRVEYLGIIIQASSVFNLAEKHLADKAQKASFILKRGIVSDQCNLISPKVALSLFKSYVKPILTYGSEIWSVATPRNLKTKTYFYSEIHTLRMWSTCNLQEKY